MDSLVVFAPYFYNIEYRKTITKIALDVYFKIYSRPRTFGFPLIVV